jgi:hypothetical protein
MWNSSTVMLQEQCSCSTLAFERDRTNVIVPLQVLSGNASYIILRFEVVDVNWGIEKNNTVWGKKLVELIQG